MLIQQVVLEYKIQNAVDFQVFFQYLCSSSLLPAPSFPYVLVAHALLERVATLKQVGVEFFLRGRSASKLHASACARAPQAIDCARRGIRAAIKTGPHCGAEF